MYDPDWEIVEGSFSPFFDDGQARSGPELSAAESLFALSNGYVGIRGVWGDGNGLPGTFVNGYFERTPIVYGENAYGYAPFHETLVSLPDGTGFRFSLDAYDLGRDGRVVSKGRRLDIQHGVLEASLVWEAPDGRRLALFTERLASLARPNLAAFRIRCRLSGGAGRVTARTELRTKPDTLRSSEDPRVGAKFDRPPYSVDRYSAEGALSAAGIRTRNSGLSLSCASLCAAQGVRPSRPEAWGEEAALSATPGGGEPLRAEGIVDRASDGEFPILRTSFETEAEDGGGLILIKFLSYVRDPACGAAWTDVPAPSAEASFPDSRDRTLAREDLVSEAKADARGAAALGFGSLREEHAGVLESFWRDSGIDMEGPPGLLAALRFNIFHVFQAAGRDGRTNVSAKGLTGEGYEGHYFWDTEIYLLPLISYTAPDVAASLLRYRAALLDQARSRAREMGHAKGALFPWRTISGRETSAYYPAGTAQYHIDADIAYAVLRYAKASGDADFLFGDGAEILVETARLWTDMGHYGRDGAFRIDEVTGPDEYSALVNNNAYTNIMARANLQEAAELVARMEDEAPEAFKVLRDRVGLEPRESASWVEAARSMYIPRDETTGIIPQDDSFLDREPWDFSGTPASKYPLLLHFHPLVIYRKQVLKQPDLLLALALRPSEFTLAEKKRNFDFYEPLTTGDSSLSHCAMSIAAARAGYTEKAWAYFLKTVRLDLDDLQGNAAHGVHIAAMGGSWSSLVYGFAGFWDDGKEYSFSPRLPQALRRLAFRLRIGSGALDVSLTQGDAEYRWTGPAPLVIRSDAERLTLQNQGAAHVDLRPRCRAVIFDLDGVIADTAVLHTRAWKRLAAEEGLSVEGFQWDRLKGISRMESLEILLGARASEVSKAEKEALAERKNAYYRQLVSALTPADALPGSLDLLRELRGQNIKTGLASASRNAAEVLSRLELTEYFDAVPDAAQVRPKPDPEIFLKAAQMLGVRRYDCVGVEDAQAGIEAIRRADMKSVGVGERLSGADFVVAGLAELKGGDFSALFQA